MPSEYRVEDVFSLTVLLSLLAALACYAKILIEANHAAWLNIKRDKAVAKATSSQKKTDKTSKNKATRRIPESELKCNAWFGGTYGLLSILWYWHKVRKPIFLLDYGFRCAVGIAISVAIVVVYLAVCVQYVVFFWPSDRHLMTHFLEWREQLSV